VRTQLVMQLAAPVAYDLNGEDLGKYKSVKPLFDQWSHVADVCGKVTDSLLNACLEALRADASLEAQQAQTKIATWRDARAAGDTPPLSKLPGL
jgi:hypothetical protein